MQTNRTITVLLKTLDLLGQVLVLMYMIKAPRSTGFQVFPNWLYPLPVWQLLSFLLHLPFKKSWKAKKLRKIWILLLIPAMLLTPFAIIPGVGLLAIALLLFLWPATMIFYWIITILELIKLSGNQMEQRGN